jgi:hypothetical protein
MSEVRIERWRRFVHKWVLNFDGPRVMKLSYEQALSDPAGGLTRLVQFFRPGEPANPGRIRHVLKKVPMKPGRKLELFRHYDRVWFSGLETRARDEIEAAGLPLLFN